MTTFPNVTVTDIVAVDCLGHDTDHAKLPCLFCMMRGEFDRYKAAKLATKVVVIADLMVLPLCEGHAEEFEGDKR